jgi:hypothetical protein
MTVTGEVIVTGTTKVILVSISVAVWFQASTRRSRQAAKPIMTTA